MKMSQCPNHCHTCQNESNEEHKLAFKEAVSILTCQAGLMPEPDLNMEGVPDLRKEVHNDNDNDDEPCSNEESPKEGDHIFVMTIPCKAKFVLSYFEID
jgi:hypothetical protein